MKKIKMEELKKKRLEDKMLIKGEKKSSNDKRQNGICTEQTQTSAMFNFKNQQITDGTKTLCQNIRN